MGEQRESLKDVLMVIILYNCGTFSLKKNSNPLVTIDHSSKSKTGLVNMIFIHGKVFQQPADGQVFLHSGYREILGIFTNLPAFLYCTFKYFTLVHGNSQH